MPEPANSYAKQPTQQKTFYDRLLLERLLPELHFFEYGQKYKRTIPEHEGATINFRRFNSLPVPNQPLVSGVTPAGHNLSISELTTTVRQEGSFVMLTDWIDKVGIDPVVTETIELISEQAALTLDRRVRDVIFNGANVYFVGGHVDRGDVRATDVMTGSQVRRARQIMARNNVKPIEGKGAFIGFVHPDAAFDMKGDTEWRDAHTYVDVKNLISGEIGMLYSIRWIETTECPIWLGEGDGGADVYGSLVIGKNGYGIVDVAGSSTPETIVKNKDEGGTSDPLNQRSTVGWKAAFACVRLNELVLLRIEHGTQL